MSPIVKVPAPKATATSSNTRRPQTSPHPVDTHVATSTAPRHIPAPSPEPERVAADGSRRGLSHRTHTRGTVLASIMSSRHIKLFEIAGALHVSDKTMYRYLTRQIRVPAMKLGTLCDLVDMDPDELIDSEGLLLESEG